MQIDWWTLALQTVNFLVLIWLLSRFLYRPITAILAERRATLEAKLAAAETARHSVDDSWKDIAAARKGFAAERDKLLAEGRAHAESERQTLLAQTKEDMQKAQQEMKTYLAREQADAQRTLDARAQALAIALAGRLLARLPAGMATDMFLAELGEKIADLPPQTKTALLNHGGIEIVTAAPLDQAGQSHVRETLRRMLGEFPPATFRADPALIAGIEINSPNIALRNSWREDLRRLKEELGRDGGP